jgi:Terpene cyclase DEP1
LPSIPFRLLVLKFRLLVPKLHLGTPLLSAVALPGVCGLSTSYRWQFLRSKASGTSSVPKCNLGTRKSKKRSEQNAGLTAPVLFLFIATEGRRIALSLLWLPVIATLVVGVSLGLPLFLFLRQRKLDADAGALT